MARSRAKVMRFVVPLVVLALVVVGVFFFRPKAPTYQVGLAKVVNVVRESTFEGTLVPEFSATVSPQIGGVITSVPVTVGENVSQGQTLFEVSPSNQGSQAILSAQASLAQAQAQESSLNASTTTAPATSGGVTQLVAQAQSTLKVLCSNVKTESSQCATLKSDLNQIDTQSSKPQSKTPSSAQGQTTPTAQQAIVAADQQVVNADQSALTLAQERDQTEITSSPISGVVGAVNLTVGQNVKPGTTNAFVAVIGTGGTQVVIQVPSTSIDTVKPGQNAKVLPVGSQTWYSARVVSIGTTPTTNKATGTSTLPVTLLVDKFQRKIFDGMAAEVKLYTAQKSNVLAVPTSAITMSGSSSTVQLLKPNGSISTVAVRVGVVGALYTAVIAKGLEAGDKVVLADLKQPIPVPNVPNARVLRKAFVG